MKLVSFDGGATKEYTGFTLTFSNESRYIFSRYTGTLATQAPDTVPADATTITLTSNHQYQLTDVTSSAATITGFTSVSDSDIGRVVDILGSGGTYPSTITDANDFLLEGGATWTANAGSRISFKIKKTGSSAYTYIEVPGSRVQTA